MGQQHLNMRCQTEDLACLGTEGVFKYTPAIVLTLPIEVVKGKGESPQQKDREILISAQGHKNQNQKVKFSPALCAFYSMEKVMLPVDFGMCMESPDN